MIRPIALFIALACAGCGSCGQSGFVAELIGMQSNVDRDYAKTPEAWSRAKKGDRFVLGDGVRTGARSEATLALPRRARLLVKSDTVVRFKKNLDGTGPSEQIEMQQGEVTIDTGSLDLGVSTSRGIVKLTPESRVRMRAEPQKTRFDVVIGRVEYSVDGDARTVPAGEGFEVTVPAVVPDQVRTAPVPAPSLASAPPIAEPEAAAKVAPEKPAAESGTRSLADLSFPEPPSSTIVTLPAGETATIHDPKPPADVRITFTSCPELGVLELDRGNGRFDAVRARGDGDVRVRVPRGNFKYRLRCARAGRVQTAAAEIGRLTVVADAATRPLPLAPATITADADGRRYTVSYQNRLPKITLRWPDAPRTNSYRLFVRPDKGAQLSVDSTRSSVTLEPGRVGEGLHQFWFETRDKQRSEQGQLQVSFDYTARTAYLTSPLEGEAKKNGRARFAGGTLLGSNVHVQGIAQKLDPKGRFTATVDVPAGTEGAYVRVQHRSTGVHYYIRHLK